MINSFVEDPKQKQYFLQGPPRDYKKPAFKDAYKASRDV